MTSETGCLDLLRTESRTVFVLDKTDRIRFENDPENSKGPLFYLARCKQGTIALVHREIDGGLAGRLLRIAATEPVPASLDDNALRLGQYLELLGGQFAEPVPGPGISYHLPTNLEVRSDVELVSSGTTFGDRLVERLHHDGMPLDLIELGFRNPEDFWPPWCVAMHEGNIVSVGMTARLSEIGAESGIVTVPGYRRQGFAAAAVAGWARHPDLTAKTLFYSAAQENVASIGVARRLGLRFIGTTLRITAGEPD